jgi:hypothetical protein
MATMATILTSCLEREGQGGHRCIVCQNFEEAVQQNASRVRNKNRGDTGKLYKCTKKIYMTASPSIIQSFIDAIRTPFVAARLFSAVQQHQLFPPSLVVGLPRETTARSTPQRTRTRSIYLMSLRRRSIGCVSIMKKIKTNTNQHKDH